MQQLHDMYERWQQFAETRRGQRFVKGARYAFLAGVVAFLAYQLTSVGWGEIYRSLPTQPLFYVFFALIYLSLPLTESVMYRLVWDYPVLRSIPMFLNKRVYNQQVFGYSGEVYLFLWARDQVGKSKRDVGLTIKDNNIVSSVASTFIAAVLLAAFVFTGQIEIGRWVEGIDMLYVIAGAGLGAVLVSLGVKFRRFIFSLSGTILALFFVIHCARLLLNNAFQVAQWYVVLPEVSLGVWFTFLAALIILTRIPLPNRDLLFVGAGVELAAALGIPAAPIAGMLLVNSVLQKVVGFTLFCLITMTQKGDPIAADEAVSAANVSAAPRNGEAEPKGEISAV